MKKRTGVGALVESPENWMWVLNYAKGFVHPIHSTASGRALAIPRIWCLRVLPARCCPMPTAVRPSMRRSETFFSPSPWAREILLGYKFFCCCPHITLFLLHPLQQHLATQDHAQAGPCWGGSNSTGIRSKQDKSGQPDVHRYTRCNLILAIVPPFCQHSTLSPHQSLR